MYFTEYVFVLFLTLIGLSKFGIELKEPNTRHVVSNAIFLLEQSKRRKYSTLTMPYFVQNYSFNPWFGSPIVMN